jgi:hypothetical protein
MSSYSDFAHDASAILMHRGEIRANETLQKAGIDANLVSTLGQVATRLPQQIHQARADDREQKIADVFKRHGSDLDGAIDEVSGIDPKMGLELRTRKNAADKAAYDYKLAQHEGALKNLQFMSGLIGSATDQNTYTQALYTATAAGLDVSKLSPEYNADFVANLNRQALTAKERLELAKPVPPRLINTVNGAGENVQRFVTPKEGDEFKSQPPKEPTKRVPAAGSLEDFILKSYGNDATAQEILKGKKEYTEAGQKETGAPDELITKLTPEGLQLAALNYRKTGNMPAFGFTKGVREQVINTAASLTPDQMRKIEAGGTDVAYNAASYKADSDSLKRLQSMTDNITAFESTAGKNIDMFLKEAGKIVDIGSPLMNRPVRAVTGELLGSKDQAGFNTARQVALTEASRVLTTANLSGVVSDSARREVGDLSDPNATLGQAVRAMRILRQDMKNRLDSNTTEIAAIKKRITDNGLGDQPAASDASGHKVGDPVTYNGKKYVIKAIVNGQAQLEAVP